MKSHGIQFTGEMVRALLAGRKTMTRRTSAKWAKVKAGDELWVRENYSYDEQRDGVLYQADLGSSPEGTRWISSMVMPRWSSRITLRATADARQERLTAITEDDAMAEGVEPDDQSAVEAFIKLWERVHGPGSFDEAPDVWVLAFEVVT